MSKESSSSNEASKKGLPDEFAQLYDATLKYQNVMNLAGEAVGVKQVKAVIHYILRDRGPDEVWETKQALIAARILASRALGEELPETGTKHPKLSEKAADLVVAMVKTLNEDETVKDFNKETTKATEHKLVLAARNSKNKEEHKAVLKQALALKGTSEESVLLQVGRVYRARVEKEADFGADMEPESLKGWFLILEMADFGPEEKSPDLSF